MKMKIHFARNSQGTRRHRCARAG